MFLHAPHYKAVHWIKKKQQAYGQRLLLQVNRSDKTKVVPVQCMEDSDGC